MGVLSDRYKALAGTPATAPSGRLAQQYRAMRQAAPADLGPATAQEITTPEPLSATDEARQRRAGGITAPISPLSGGSMGAETGKALGRGAGIGLQMMAGAQRMGAAALDAGGGPLEPLAPAMRFAADKLSPAGRGLIDRFPEDPTIQGPSFENGTIGNFQWYLNLGAEMAPAMAGSMATGNPLLAAGMMGMGEAGGLVEEQLGRGKTEQEAIATGLKYLPVGVAMEAIPFGEYLGKAPVTRGLRNMLGETMTRRAGARLGGALATEVPTEMVQEGYQAGLLGDPIMESAVQGGAAAIPLALFGGGVGAMTRNGGNPLAGLPAPVDPSQVMTRGPVPEGLPIGPPPPKFEIMPPLEDVPPPVPVRQFTPGGREIGAPPPPDMYADIPLPATEILPPPPGMPFARPAALAPIPAMKKSTQRGEVIASEEGNLQWQGQGREEGLLTAAEPGAAPAAAPSAPTKNAWEMTADEYRRARAEATGRAPKNWRADYDAMVKAAAEAGNDVNRDSVKGLRIIERGELADESDADFMVKSIAPRDKDVTRGEIVRLRAPNGEIYAVTTRPYSQDPVGQRFWRYKVLSRPPVVSEEAKALQAKLTDGEELTQRDGTNIGTWAEATRREAEEMFGQLRPAPAPESVLAPAPTSAISRPEATDVVQGQPAAAGKQPWEMTREEFGKTASLYHGSRTKGIRKFKPNTAEQLGSAVYFASDPSAPRDEFGAGGELYQASLASTAKVFDARRGQIPPGVEDTAAWRDKWANEYDDARDAWSEEGSFAGEVFRELGYDAVIMTSPEYGVETAVLNPDVIITHRDAVQTAVEQGDPVPRAVLADYAGEPWADAALAKLPSGETPATRPAENTQPAALVKVANKIIEPEIQKWGDYARQYEGGRGIAVGSEGTDYRHREAGMMTMLRAIKNGASLDEAAAQAKEDARKVIATHNSRRKDTNWQRWEGGVDQYIDWAKRDIEDALKASPSPTPETAAGGRMSAEEPQGGAIVPPPIPDGNALRRMNEQALNDLARAHNVDGAGSLSKAEAIAELLTAREAKPGADTLIPDAGEMVEEQPTTAMQQKFDAIQKALASGKTLYARTAYRATKLTKPEQVTLKNKGREIFIPSGKSGFWITAPMADDLARQAGMNLDSRGNLFVDANKMVEPHVAPPPAAPKKPRAQRQPDGERVMGHDELRRRQLKDIQSRQYKTHGDELKMFMIKGELAADPAKWAVGEGVGYYAGRASIGKRGEQINRGFRIVSIDAENKTAVVRQVADTGLTSTGGDLDRVGDTTVHLADLVRDKKYGAGSPKSPRGPGRSQRGAAINPAEAAVAGYQGTLRAGGRAGELANQAARRAAAPVVAKIKTAAGAAAEYVPAPVRRFVARMATEEFAQTPQIKALHEAYKAEVRKSDTEAEGLLRTLMRDVKDEKEMLAADRILRGHPTDIDGLSDALLKSMGTNRDEARKIAQRMTADMQALGLPIREEWLEADRFWYPNVWGKHEARGVLGRIFAKPAKSMAIRNPEAAHTKRRTTDRFSVLNKRTGRLADPDAVFATEAEAQAFIRQHQGGRFGVKYKARDERGKFRTVVEYFETAKAREEFINSESDTGSIRIDEEMTLKNTIDRDAMVILHPMTPEQMRAHGLIEDVITNVRRFKNPANLVAKTRFFDGMARAITDGESQWFRTDKQMEAFNDPSYRYISDLKLNLPKKIKNPAIQKLMAGAVHKDLAADLIGAFGEKNSLTSLLMRPDVALGLRRWVTYRNPFRYPKQILENNLQLYIADSEAFADAPHRVEANVKFWSWAIKKDTADPIMREFTESGILETDFLHSTEIESVARRMSKATTLDEFDQTLMEEVSSRLAKIPVVNKLGAVDKFAHTLYNLQDAVYKFQLYSHLRGRGQSPEAAKQRVLDTMFDWERAPRLIQNLRFIPFMPSVLWQFSRVLANKMALDPVTTIMKLALTVTAAALARDEMDKAAGVKPSDRRGEIPKFRPLEFALPITDSRGRTLKFDASFLFPYSDLAPLTPNDWTSVRQIRRRVEPMWLQGVDTLMTQQSPFGRDLYFSNTKNPDKQAEQTREIMLQAVSDFMPGLLGAYWINLYRNSQRPPARRQDLPVQAITGPMGVRAAIDYGQTGSRPTRPSRARRETRERRPGY